MLANIADLSGGSGARDGSDEPGPAGPPALAQKDVTLNPTLGRSAFPDYAQRLATLWQTS